jgi:hypothetical protein
MAGNINTIVGEIDFKVRKLVLDHEKIALENKNLNTEINELKNKIENQKIEIAGLVEKIKLVKLSKTIENKRDLTETKLKINELVREIDTCISLLNK